MWKLANNMHHVKEHLQKVRGRCACENAFPPSTDYPIHWSTIHCIVWKRCLGQTDFAIWWGGLQWEHISRRRRAVGEAGLYCSVGFPPPTPPHPKYPAPVAPLVPNICSAQAWRLRPKRLYILYSRNQKMHACRQIMPICKKRHVMQLCTIVWELCGSVTTSVCWDITNQVQLSFEIPSLSHSSQWTPLLCNNSWAWPRSLADNFWPGNDYITLRDWGLKGLKAGYKQDPVAWVCLRGPSTLDTSPFSYPFFSLFPSPKPWVHERFVGPVPGCWVSMGFY